MRIPEPRHHTRRLYRSLSGRLETTKAQLDALHQFSNKNAPVSALISGESIDAKSVRTLNQKGEQRWLWDPMLAMHAGWRMHTIKRRKFFCVLLAVGQRLFQGVLHRL